MEGGTDVGKEKKKKTEQVVGKVNPLCDLSDVPHLSLGSSLTLSTLYLLLHLLLDFTHLCFNFLIQCFYEGRNKKTKSEACRSNSSIYNNTSLLRSWLLKQLLGESRTVLFKYTKLNVRDVGGNVGEVPAMGTAQRTQMGLLPRSTSPCTTLEGVLKTMTTQ